MTVYRARYIKDTEAARAIIYEHIAHALNQGQGEGKPSVGGTTDLLLHALYVPVHETTADLSEAVG